MIGDDRLESRLRRSADEVRSAVAQRATPPPIGDLDRGARWSRVAAVVLVLAAAAGLTALVVSRGPTRPDAAAVSLPAVDLTETMCLGVAAITTQLEIPPISAEQWPELVGHVDAVQRTADSVELTTEVRRRIDRFVLLTGLAVDLGTNGQQLTAASRASEASAVGHELVDYLALDNCVIADSPTSSSTAYIDPSGGS